MALTRSRIAARRPDNHLSKEEWDEKRVLLGSRSGGRCEAGTPDCFAPGGMLEAGRMSVQHRRAQGAGGTSLDTIHNLANLLLVCGDGTVGCHGWIETQCRGEALERGLWIGHTTGDDREPVPAELYPVRIGGGHWRALHPVAAQYVKLPESMHYALVMPPPHVVARYVHPMEDR